MTIRKLLWNYWNINHIWKHKVVTDEVEQVCQNKCYITKGRQASYRIIGKTDKGRYLTIIAIPKENGFYVISARGAQDNEIKEYQRKL